jgi:hypothetical protein
LNKKLWRVSYISSQNQRIYTKGNLQNDKIIPVEDKGLNKDINGSPT